MVVRAGQERSQRDPLTVHDRVPFRTQFAVIDGFGTTAWPPFCQDTGAVQAAPVSIDPSSFAEAVEQSLMQLIPNASLLLVAQVQPAVYAGTANHFRG